MIKKSVWAIICVLILIGPLAGSPDAAEIEAWAPVVKATVYRGRALVERVGVVDLLPGEHQLVVKGLPSSINQRSLRFSGKGPGGVEIAGIEVRKAYLSDAKHPGIVSLKAELKELLRKDREDNDALEGIAASQKLLDSIAAELSRQTANATRTGSLDLKRVKSLSGYLSDERTALAKRRLKTKESLKERKGKIEALEKRLDDLRSIAGKDKREVVVNISSPRAGGFTFTLAYLVYGARWRPAYIVRKEGDGVTLDYFGEVTQSTGEDWRGVELSLSTARPALGAKPPKLPPWYLDIERPRPLRKKARLGKGAMAMLAAPPQEDAEVKEARERVSVPAFTETTALFRAPGRHDLPSREGFSRFLITRLVLPAELIYVIRPEMRTFAYLVARVVNSSSYPILSGEAQTFVGPDFVGRARLKAAPRGAKFNVGFGVDQSVKVTREVVKDFKAQKLFGAKISRYLAVEIDIENLKSSPIKARVEERLPISKDKRIEVEVAKALPEPEVDLKKGKLTWERNIAQKTKDKISLELVITFPRNAPIFGL